MYSYRRFGEYHVAHHHTHSPTYSIFYRSMAVSVKQGY